MNKLSKRLEVVASFVNDNSKVIDIGCDHGLLSIYLVNKYKNVKVIASDINENGVVISGGTSLLAGMREYIEKHINIPVRLAPDPVASVVNGMKIYFGK